MQIIHCSLFDILFIFLTVILLSGLVPILPLGGAKTHCSFDLL